MYTAMYYIHACMHACMHAYPCVYVEFCVHSPNHALLCNASLNHSGCSDTAGEKPGEHHTKTCLNCRPHCCAHCVRAAASINDLSIKPPQCIQ